MIHFCLFYKGALVVLYIGEQVQHQFTVYT